MKKLWITGLIVAAGVAVGVAVHSQTADPVRHACRRGVELCNTRVADRDVDVCVEQVNEVRRVAGPQGVEHTLACMNQVNSCGGVMGCVAGGAVRSMGGFLRDLGDGMSR